MEPSRLWKDIATAKALCQVRANRLNQDNVVLTGIRRHQKILRKVSLLSVVAFVLTLIFLAYLSISESLMSRNEELGREYRLLSSSIWQGTSIQGAVERAIATGSTVPTGAAASGSARIETGGPVENENASAPAPRATPNPQPQLNDEALGFISARVAEISELVLVNDRVLRWLRLSFKQASARQSRGLLPYDIAGISTQRNLNAIVSSYILPTVAAILGVTVFLLRTASTRIRELSFQANDADVYWHRLVLGVVGGIAISWFSVTDTTGILKSITPAALAFLVGYSVEVLYNILDSLVKALGGSKN